jgi:hypothetical protein
MRLVFIFAAKLNLNTGDAVPKSACSLRLDYGNLLPTLQLNLHANRQHRF